jgi:hypothetical protein|tara:strand:+ start:711 stop:1430 length:720 start_codon:yes stop_codon:yes gene_type:complete
MAAAFDPQKFELAWKRVQDHFVQLYASLQRSGATREQIISHLVDVDIEDLVMNKFQLNGELEQIMEAYLVELKGMEAFARVDENVLKSLMKADSFIYKTKFTEAGTLIRKQMIDAVIGGLSESNFALALESAGFQPYQAASLVDDSLKKFSRNVISEMANNMPEETLYVWDGPVDNRTSDECLQLVSAGPMTKAEFGAVFPGAFENGTHFGCRHEPQRYLSKRQSKAVSADKQIAVNVA